MITSEQQILSFGDIILVPFPFTDQSSLKQRPAVVISTQSYNSQKPDVILMAITSQLRPVPSLGDVWISDWKTAGLLKPSAIKPVIATLEQSMVIRQLGTLSDADKNMLRSSLADFIG